MFQWIKIVQLQFLGKLPFTNTIYANLLRYTVKILCVCVLRNLLYLLFREREILKALQSFILRRLDKARVLGKECGN